MDYRNTKISYSFSKTFGGLHGDFGIRYSNGSEFFTSGTLVLVFIFGDMTALGVGDSPTNSLDKLYNNFN